MDIAERLKKAKELAGRASKLAFELWREHLEILLGRTAVKELFPGGKAENLDRMEAIYYGVMDAFNFNGREQRDARREASVSEVREIAEALKPVGELLALLKAAPDISQFPTVKRPNRRRHNQHVSRFYRRCHRFQQRRRSGLPHTWR